MHFRDGEAGLGEMGLAPLPCVGFEHCRQQWRQRCCACEPFEGGAKPFGIGWVTAFEQKAYPHDVSRKPRCDDARAEIVAGMASPADKGLLVGNAAPLGGQLVKDDVARTAFESFPEACKVAETVMKDFAGRQFQQSLFGQRQPGQGIKRFAWGERQPCSQDTMGSEYLDAVVEMSQGVICDDRWMRAGSDSRWARRGRLKA